MKIQNETEYAAAKKREAELRGQIERTASRIVERTALGHFPQVDAVARVLITLVSDHEGVARAIADWEHSRAEPPVNLPKLQAAMADAEYDEAFEGGRR